MSDPLSQPFVTTTLILERLKNSRDDDAWREFDERFRGVLQSTGVKLGLTDADASDAAQETIVQALRDYQGGKYDRSKGRLSSWIIGIAHHRILDVARKRQREQRVGGSLDEAQDVTIAQVTQAFDGAVERKIFEQAWDAIRSEGGLAPQTLLAFELTSLRGASTAFAAQECGMSTDQVYVAKNRVAKVLRVAVERISTAFHDGL